MTHKILPFLSLILVSLSLSAQADVPVLDNSSLQKYNEKMRSDWEASTALLAESREALAADEAESQKMLAENQQQNLREAAISPLVEVNGVAKVNAKIAELAAKSEIYKMTTVERANGTGTVYAFDKAEDHRVTCFLPSEEASEEYEASCVVDPR